MHAATPGFTQVLAIPAHILMLAQHAFVFTEPSLATVLHCRHTLFCNVVRGFSSLIIKDIPNLSSVSKITVINMASFNPAGTT